MRSSATRAGSGTANRARKRTPESFSSCAHVAPGIPLRIRGFGPGPFGDVEKFHFRPNLAFSPPDLEMQALDAMTGELWIDAAQERVARLRAIYSRTQTMAGASWQAGQGGWVVIEQADVGGGNGDRTLPDEDETSGYSSRPRALTYGGDEQYAPVPARLDYRQAIQMLRSAPGSAAQAAG